MTNEITPDKRLVSSTETEIMLASQGHTPYLEFIQRDLQSLASKNMLSEALTQMRQDGGYGISDVRPTIKDGQITAIDLTAGVGNKIHCDGAHQWACTMDTTMGSDIIGTLNDIEYAQKGVGWDFYQQALARDLATYQAKGLLPEALKRLKDEGYGAVKSADATATGADIETATGNRLHYDAAKRTVTVDTSLGSDVLHTALDVDHARQFPDAFSKFLQTDLQQYAQRGQLAEVVRRMKDDWGLAPYVGGVHSNVVNGKVVSIDFVGGSKTVHADAAHNWAVTLENPTPEAGKI
jgi:hypothetical protein